MAKLAGQDVTVVVTHGAFTSLNKTDLELLVSWLVHFEVVDIKQAKHFTFSFCVGKKNDEVTKYTISTGHSGSTQPTATVTTATPATAVPVTTSASTIAATPNTGTTISATPNTGTTISATPNTGTTISAKPNTGTTISAKPNTGTTISATPNTGTTIGATPNTGTTITATPNTGTTIGATPNSVTTGTATENSATSITTTVAATTGPPVSSSSSEILSCSISPSTGTVLDAFTITCETEIPCSNCQYCFMADGKFFKGLASSFNKRLIRLFSNNVCFLIELIIVFAGKNLRCSNNNVVASIFLPLGDSGSNYNLNIAATVKKDSFVASTTITAQVGQNHDGLKRSK